MQHNALVVPASIHLDQDSTMAGCRNGTIIAQCDHDMVWKGVELVELVTIGAHDLGCTRINEPFV